MDMSHIWFVILGCEIGFWAVVLAGLVARYLLRRPRLSTGILLAVPVVDLALVAAVSLDLSSGAPVQSVHRLAGIYLGVTVAFGHSMIAWADGWFAHRFAGGPRPRRTSTTGPAALRHEVTAFARWLAAAAIAAGITWLLAITVADDSQARDLYGIFPTLGVVTAIWLVTGPVWTAVSGGRRRGSDVPAAQQDRRTRHRGDRIDEQQREPGQR